MRLKRIFLICGLSLILVIIYIIYSAQDLSHEDDIFPDNFQRFEDKITKLEQNLIQHHDTIEKLKDTMNGFIKFQTDTKSQQIKSISKPHPVYEREILTSYKMLYNATCALQLDFPPPTDVQMLDLYKQLKFENIDGGAWKQGWRIEVDEKEWNRSNKLKVFVIPHSHNDPGWIKTLDEYYITQTKHILNNMLVKLPVDPRRKFIWAEISYFSMWWDDLGNEERESVKRLIKKNQLEIVSGGWVMNDEANSHWASTVQQYIDGHQWLNRHLNYTPRSSWSIDPFGLSPTQSALLKEMGFQNLLIQRVHYSVKKYLARNKQLEFKWRQLWDNKGRTDLLTQVMPFYGYDIPHTCGPDPKICCQFDFKRLPGYGLQCPWKVPPQVITDKNVAERALLLLDQYRKKSKLFKSNVLLVPLGDDFRYDHILEWDDQYNNYQRLFDYMNSQLNLHVQIQFGTLTDYFDALRKEKAVDEFPVLSGDFFTYSDRDDHYWSGYYTSRPFYKRMDRVLLSYIRAADGILTLAYLSGHIDRHLIAGDEAGLAQLMVEVRRALSLFQHHDGITGTARDPVVVDYGKRMLSAIHSSQKVIQLSTQVLLSPDNVDVSDSDSQYYNIDDIRHNHNDLPDYYSITIGPELTTKNIVIYNSLTFTRHEVVVFYVSTPFVEVTNYEQNRVICQISPVFEYGASMSQNKYQLSFIVDIPALSLVTYTVTAVDENKLSSDTHIASVSIYNYFNDNIKPPLGFPNIQVQPFSEDFYLNNSQLTAYFNGSGLLKSIKIGSRHYPVHLDFAKYGVMLRREKSGGYLFLPDGDATPIPVSNIIVNVIRGPILSSVTVQLPHVLHTVVLYNTPGADGLGIEVSNVVDIKKTLNFELAMRLSTNINSSDEFFTDLNGYQILRRKKFNKLPLQANYYPMPTMMYIEDTDTRLSVVTSTPLGCSSLKSGQLEIMLDRRLNQDDNLGLGQGILDNHPTKHTFRILIEKRKDSCYATSKSHPSGMYTLSSHVSLQTLLNPLVKLLRIKDEDIYSQPYYQAVTNDFGVDFNMPVLRTGILIKNVEYLGFVLQRQFIDTCFSNPELSRRFPLSQGSVNIAHLLKTDNLNYLQEASLSFLSLNNKTSINSNINMCPMEVKAFILH